MAVTSPPRTTTEVRVDFGDRSARRRRRLRIAATAVAVVVAGVAVWLVAFSSVFAVKAVRVVGVEGERATAVLGVADVPVGLPIARVDTSAAQAAIAALPWVSAVEVRRGWPSEIVLAVSPRVPIANLVSTAGRQVVDADGVAFDAPGPQPADLPVVRAEGDGIATATAVLVSLPPQIARATTSVSATTRDNVDLHLRSGVLVHWGSADQAEAKAAVLLALMRHKANVYDVTAPELPTTFKR